MKEIPKLSRFDAVKILWIDAHSEDGWISKDKYEDVKKQDMIVETIGYYLDHDDKWLRICFGRALWDGVPNFVINVFSIPRVNIKNVIVL